MFFPEHVSALQDDRYEVDVEIDVSNPVLMGYIFSRPDDIIRELPPSARRTNSHKDEPQEYEQSELPRRRHNSRYSEPYSSPVEIVERHRASTIYGHNAFKTIRESRETERTNISGFILDYYQHPAKHADPQRLYRHAYDVYSLGILLVEIGLWGNLQSYDDVPDNENNEDHYERRRRICREHLPNLRWLCGDTYVDVALKCLMVDCSDDEAGMVSERELCANIVADL